MAPNIQTYTLKYRAAAVKMVLVKGLTLQDMRDKCILPVYRPESWLGGRGRSCAISGLDSPAIQAASAMLIIQIPFKTLHLCPAPFAHQESSTSECLHNSYCRTVHIAYYPYLRLDGTSSLGTRLGHRHRRHDRRTVGYGAYDESAWRAVGQGNDGDHHTADGGQALGLRLILLDSVSAHRVPF
jgi:hypothetical protein